MAAKGLFGLQAKVFSCCSATSVQNVTAKYWPLLNYQQTRGRRRYEWKDKDAPEPWHIKEDAPFIKEHLVPENKEFLKRLAEDQYLNSPSPLKDELVNRNNFDPTKTKRTGLVGFKIGKVPQWKKDGTRVMCDVLQLSDNHVIEYLTPEEFQRSLMFKPNMSKEVGLVKVGGMSLYPSRVSEEYGRQFEKVGVPPKKLMTKFLITEDAAIQPGTPLNVMHFKVGQYVDCSSKTIDHGFQGVVKKWGFAKMPASHGNKQSHRRPGSMATGKQRGMFKGTKMPGLMGNDWNIHKGLKVWRINTRYNLLYVSTGTSGPTHCKIRVYDTALYHRREKWDKVDYTLPMPTYYDGDNTQHIPEDLYDDELYQFKEESISFNEPKKS